ncbi:MAG: SDR family NAD(P)-dependent oxidoreductase [Promethearchaeota archaeon]
MKDFNGKVAVITGSASGIGYGIAEKCVKENMKVVLADINKDLLKTVEINFRNEGADIISLVTDVSKPNDMEKLAKKTLRKYGAVHLLFLNAGVSNSKYTWNYTLEDWHWQIDVNLYGVIHGIRIFTPIMLKQSFECHIINTSSIEGLLFGSGPGGAIYGVTKHGVISLSETLKRELELKEAKLKVSVLCPGWVQTEIGNSAPHRQKKYKNSPNDEIIDSKVENLINEYSGSLDRSKITPEIVQEISPEISPQKVAEIVFQAIKNDKFYILTHKDQFLKRLVKERLECIMREFD